LAADNENEHQEPFSPPASRGDGSQCGPLLPESVEQSLWKDKAGGAGNWPQKHSKMRFVLGRIAVVLLRKAVLLLGVLVDPGVDPFGELCQQQEVVAIEAGGVTPLFPFRL
jgi:hypothetical protein